MNGPAPTVRDAEAGAGFSLVEVLIALLVLTIGMLAVAGLASTVAQQTREGSWRSDQTLVAQQVVMEVVQDGYASASSYQDTLPMGGHEWPVQVTVTTVATDLKEVEVEVEGRGGMDARTYTTRLHRRVPLPASR